MTADVIIAPGYGAEYTALLIRGLSMHKLATSFSYIVTRVTLCLLVFCHPGLSHAENSVLDRVVENGVLRVAMSVDQPPFNMRNRSKTIVGFDVDLAQALAGAMHVKLEIVELPFGDLLPALVQDKVDAVISGISITPERTLQVSFIGPYTLSGKSMLTTARIKKVVKNPAEFNDPEIRIVALNGSTSESFVKSKLPRASLATIPNYNEGIEQLLTGSVDAMVADIPVLQIAKLRYPEAGLDIIEPQLSVEPLGIAIGKEDRQFANLLRNYLHAFEKVGLIPNLRKKWFEDNSWMATLP